MYSYKIGEKNYVQKPLVLGQYQQLMKEITGVSFPSEATYFDIVAVLGDRIHKVLAIVLIPEEITNLRDKNNDELADEISFNIDVDTTFKVVEDFFVCNDISLLLKRLNQMMGNITEKMTNQEIVETI
jgi:hypothetical protein